MNTYIAQFRGLTFKRKLSFVPSHAYLVEGHRGSAYLSVMDFVEQREHGVKLAAQWIKTLRLGKPKVRIVNATQERRK